MVIITSGIPRKPGMSRDDLLATKTRWAYVTANVAKKGPRRTHGDHHRVEPARRHVRARCRNVRAPAGAGARHGGILDTGAPLQDLLGMELGVSVEDIHGMVLGGHGDTMVPLPRHTSVGGIPLTELGCPQERIDAIIKRTRDGGAEIVSLLKTGSAYYAPAASSVAMVESILKDKKRVLPCAVQLSGEYGYKDLFIGVPVVLGQERRREGDRALPRRGREVLEIGRSASSSRPSSWSNA